MPVCRKIALHFFTIQQTKQARLLLGFNTLSHHLELERIHQTDDGGHQGRE